MDAREAASLVKEFKDKEVHYSPDEFYHETGWMPATEILILSWN